MMLSKPFLIILFFLFIISNRNISCKSCEATINSDCYYYQKNNNKPSGNLLKGQKIVVLADFYLGLRADGIYFDIFVEVKTLDDMIKGYVRESCISYLSRNNNNLWFKYILLTRDYYYTSTVEDVYRKEYLPLLDEGVQRIDSIKMMGHFFSEHRMLVSEKYFILGNDHGDAVYHLLNVKKDGNKYILYLTDRNKKEFEITLLDCGDSITVIHISSKDEIFFQSSITGLLNTKYVKHDLEKSKILKRDIIHWVQNNS